MTKAKKETVEQFLARGGEIEQIPQGVGQVTRFIKTPGCGVSRFKDASEAQRSSKRFVQNIKAGEK